MIRDFLRAIYRRIVWSGSVIPGRPASGRKVPQTAREWKEARPDFHHAHVAGDQEPAVDTAVDPGEDSS